MGRRANHSQRVIRTACHYELRCVVRVTRDEQLAPFCASLLYSVCPSFDLGRRLIV
jgi:hypothetical protein